MKKTLFIFCFIAGIAVAVGMRLLPHHDDHSRHSVAALPAINLLQQPLRAMNDSLLTLADVIADDEYLLINFWATWCAPCLHEMPLLQEAQSMHAVKTIGVSYEETAAISAFGERLAVEYPLYKSSFDIFYFFQQQGNRGAALPYTVLIDKQGNILKDKIGDFKTAADIVRFIQESV